MTNRAKQLTAGAAALASICAGVIIGVAPAQGAEQWTDVGPYHATEAEAWKDVNTLCDDPVGFRLRSGVMAGGAVDGPIQFRAWATCTNKQPAT